MKKLLGIISAAVLALTIAIPSTANAASNSVYTVKSGDTMWRISKNLHVNYGTLLKDNPQIKNPAVIYIGEKINIPGSSQSSGNKTYTVQSGDTMWKISQRLGVSYSSLVQANPQISNPSMIYAGESINIPGQSSGSSNQGKSLNSYEQQVAQLTNQQRAKYGLPPLKVSLKLSHMARVKAADMRDHNYFDHNSPTYGSPFNMMKQFGISYSYAGENIAAGQKTPQEVVTAWMNSPGHRANILNKKLHGNWPRLRFRRIIRNLLGTRIHGSIKFIQDNART